MQEDAAARSPIWLEVLNVDVETRLAMLASSSRSPTRLMWSSGTHQACAVTRTTFLGRESLCRMSSRTEEKDVCSAKMRCRGERAQIAAVAEVYLEASR